MLDHVVAFSKSGLVLWSTTLCKLNGDPIDLLIREHLLEDRGGLEKKAAIDNYIVKWTFDNKRDIVFVAVYQKILQLLYVEELLEVVKEEFVNAYGEQIKSRLTCDPFPFDDTFLRILRNVETKALRQKKKRVQKSFHQTKKGQSSNQATEASGQSLNPAEGTADDDDKRDESSGIRLENSNPDEEFEELKRQQALKKLKARSMKSGAAKKGKKKKSGGEDGTEKKREKKKRDWGPGTRKLTKEEMEALDRSKKLTEEEEVNALRQMRDEYIGDDTGGDSDEEEDWSGEEEETEGEYASEGPGSPYGGSDASLYSASESEGFSSGGEGKGRGGWSFGRTRLGGLLQSLSGNKELTREDIEPIMEQLQEQLIAKNVAREIAEALCETVTASLEGQQMESFTRVSTVVKQALERALERILVPKKSTDVLREIMAANATGRPYTIVFIGVNGVGKSTSLSKVCYYLKSKGINVLIAACDTFRSGAVEQLRTHSQVLDVPLFEKGYAKDPSAVCGDAMQYARNNGFDCLLVDTAGRMQNNEPLMRALAKLVSNNQPDLVLFVGEALVGNDGIDQLQMFNQALADYSPVPNPHTVDGIVLTKFDTIDDKVGATVSMVYKTGQPVIFVGTGQKYTHLKKLNVRSVLKALVN